MKITQYSDYKDFIRDQTQTSEEKERGAQARLARWAGCQPSYLSQVVASPKKHLTLDQMLGIAVGLGLDEAEQEYLLTLLEKARAQSPKLVRFLDKKLIQLRRSSKSYSKAVDAQSILDPLFEFQYCSSWLWGAVHVGVSLPEIQNAKNLADRLGVSEIRVNEILLQLEKQQLIKRRASGMGWDVLKAEVHTPADHSSHLTNHLNWRHKSIQSLQSGSSQNESLHLSFAFTMSRKDAKKLRQLLLDQMLASRELIAPSKPEDLFGLNLDFYKL